jgi:HEAT repeat protein
MTVEYSIEEQTNSALSGYTINELVRLIADSSPDSKQKAIDVVTLVGLKVCLPFLEAAVRNDADADLRNGAMEALVAFGEMAIPHLTKLLTDDNEEVRNFSAVMLGDIGNPRAVEPLIGALKDPEANVRHGAAEALGKIGDKRAVAPLQEMGNGDFWDQFYSSAALELLAGTDTLEAVGISSES